MLPTSVTAKEANHTSATSMRRARSKATPKPAGLNALPNVALGATSSAPNPWLKAAKAVRLSASTS